MNWLLICIVLLIAGNMVWGFEKGLLRVLYSMLGWIVVLAMAVLLTPQVGIWLQSCTSIREGIGSQATAFFLIMLVGRILLGSVVGILDLIAKLPLLHQVNRFLGILAGLFKGLFLTQLLLWGVELFEMTAVGKSLMDCICTSPVLCWLYENNVVKDIITSFL